MRRDGERLISRVSPASTAQFVIICDCWGELAQPSFKAAPSQARNRRGFPVRPS